MTIPVPDETGTVLKADMGGLAPRVPLITMPQ
jgi:hypothetical protein